MGTDTIAGLVGSVRERINSLVAAELEHLGLSGLVPSHGAILARLYAAGPQTMGELAQACDRRKNTVTSLVRKLEAAGYIRREADSGDARITRIALTDRGERLKTDFEAVSKRLLDAIWGDMPQADRQALMAGLRRVRSNLG